LLLLVISNAPRNSGLRVVQSVIFFVPEQIKEKMNPITITRKLEFDAGHRLLNHEGKCAHLHGHRYTAEITVTADELDAVGRVVDFSVIKERVGEWIDDNLDHNMILHVDDPLWRAKDVLGSKPPYILPDNPTAENIAKLIFAVSVVKLEDTGIKVLNVRIYETPNCWADYGFDQQPTT